MLCRSGGAAVGYGVLEGATVCYDDAMVCHAVLRWGLGYGGLRCARWCYGVLRFATMMLRCATMVLRFATVCYDDATVCYRTISGSEPLPGLIGAVSGYYRSVTSRACRFPICGRTSTITRLFRLIIALAVIRIRIRHIIRVQVSFCLCLLDIPSCCMSARFCPFDFLP